jgi:AbrB family looped-hinge helix DNA binding protein
MGLPIILKVSVVKVGNSLRIAVPKPVVDQLNLKIGDMMEITLEGEKMIVRKEEK